MLCYPEFTHQTITQHWTTAKVQQPHKWSNYRDKVPRKTQQLMHLWWRRTVILTSKRVMIIVTLLVGIWISVSTYTQNEKSLFQQLNNIVLFEHYFILGNASKSISCPFFLIPFSMGTNIMDTKWNGIGHRSNLNLDLYLSEFIKGFKSMVMLCSWQKLYWAVYVNRSKVWMIEFSMHKQAIWGIFVSNCSIKKWQII